MPQVSERRLCRLLDVPRSAVYKRKKQPAPSKPVVDEGLAKEIRRLIERFPSYGYRRIWALLRNRLGWIVNKKKVYRLMKLKGWLMHQRQETPRPRVKGRRSLAEASDQRWAMDVTHVDCGPDGWAHLCAIIDCHDRQCVGYEFALRGRAKEAERALEAACIARFGTLYPHPELAPQLRSDNGLIFQSRRFRRACRAYRLKQEFITPYTPQQNGMVERFFRSFKEECVWVQSFASFREAKYQVEMWIRWYNEARPHQALGYRSPVEYRRQQVSSVA